MFTRQSLQCRRFIKFSCCFHSFEIKGSIEWNCFEEEFKLITTFFIFRIKMKPSISKATQASHNHRLQTTI